MSFDPQSSYTVTPMATLCSELGEALAEIKSLIEHIDNLEDDIEMLEEENYDLRADSSNANKILDDINTLLNGTN